MRLLKSSHSENTVQVRVLDSTIFACESLEVEYFRPFANFKYLSSIIWFSLNSYMYKLAVTQRSVEIILNSSEFRILLIQIVIYLYFSSRANSSAD